MCSEEEGAREGEDVGTGEAERCAEAEVREVGKPEEFALDFEEQQQPILQREEDLCKGVKVSLEKTRDSRSANRVGVVAFRPGMRPYI